LIVIVFLVEEEDRSALPGFLELRHPS
jgi:hypothetical protein